MNVANPLILSSLLSVTVSASVYASTPSRLRRRINVRFDMTTQQVPPLTAQPLVHLVDLDPHSPPARFVRPVSGGRRRCQHEPVPHVGLTEVSRVQRA